MSMDSFAGFAPDPEDDGAPEAPTDEQAIEYWLWTGSRLIPASPDPAERRREGLAWPRLECWQQLRALVTGRLDAYLATLQRYVGRVVFGPVDRVRSRRVQHGRARVRAERLTN
jgi:hypothetical protein